MVYIIVYITERLCLNKCRCPWQYILNLLLNSHTPSYQTFLSSLHLLLSLPSIPFHLLFLFTWNLFNFPPFYSFPKSSVPSFLLFLPIISPFSIPPGFSLLSLLHPFTPFPDAPHSFSFPNIPPFHPSPRIYTYLPSHFLFYPFFPFIFSHFSIPAALLPFSWGSYKLSTLLPLQHLVCPHVLLILVIFLPPLFPPFPRGTVGNRGFRGGRPNAAYLPPPTPKVI